MILIQTFRNGAGITFIHLYRSIDFISILTKIHKESEPNELQIMNIEKCYASLCLPYILNDLFDKK